MAVEKNIRQLRSDPDQLLRWMRDYRQIQAADYRDVVEKTPSKVNQQPSQTGPSSPLNTKRVIEETVEQTIRILSTPSAIPTAADKPLANETAQVNALEQTSAKTPGPIPKNP